MSPSKLTNRVYDDVMHPQRGGVRTHDLWFKRDDEQGYKTDEHEYFLFSSSLFVHKHKIYRLFVSLSEISIETLIELKRRCLDHRP